MPKLETWILGVVCLLIGCLLVAGGLGGCADSCLQPDSVSTEILISLATGTPVPDKGDGAVPTPAGGGGPPDGDETPREGGGGPDTSREDVSPTPAPGGGDIGAPHIHHVVPLGPGEPGEPSPVPLGPGNPGDPGGERPGPSDDEAASTPTSEDDPAQRDKDSGRPNVPTIWETKYSEDELITVSGTVTAPEGATGTVDIDCFVKDATNPAGRTIANKQKVDNPGPYSMKVPKNLGELYLESFMDLDHNARPNGKDPRGAYAKNPLVVKDKDISGIDIVLAGP